MATNRLLACGHYRGLDGGIQITMETIALCYCNKGATATGRVERASTFPVLTASQA